MLYHYQLQFLNENPYKLFDSVRHDTMVRGLQKFLKIQPDTDGLDFIYLHLNQLFLNFHFGYLPDVPVITANCLIWLNHPQTIAVCSHMSIIGNTYAIENVQVQLQSQAHDMYLAYMSKTQSPDSLFPNEPIKPFKELPKEFRIGTFLRPKRSERN